jgi:hypothetical protein
MKSTWPYIRFYVSSRLLKEGPRNIGELPELPLVFQGIVPASVHLTDTDTGSVMNIASIISIVNIGVYVE